MIDAVAKALFVLAALIVGIVYGYVSTQLNLFPKPVLAQAYRTVRDLGRHWQNDFKLVPTRQL